jgi:DNA-binding NarL/FixJ family response regulator
MHLTSSTMVTHTPSRGGNEVGISQAAASSPFLARSLAISGLRVRRLTERERQVALLVAEGLKDALIARRLGLSASTVGTYVQHIQQRLQLDSRAEIAAWVTARRDPDDPTGRLRRAEAQPDVRPSSGPAAAS